MSDPVAPLEPPLGKLAAGARANRLLGAILRGPPVGVRRRIALDGARAALGGAPATLDGAPATPDGAAATDGAAMGA